MVCIERALRIWTMIILGIEGIMVCIERALRIWTILYNIHTETYNL